MPIYEYACDSCNHQFEVKQKFSDPLVTECEKCGNSVRKLISAPGIMFKGTGWYVTDYSNKLKDPQKSGETEKTDKPKDSAGGETQTPSSDTTTATTPSGSKSESGTSQTSTGSGSSSSASTGSTTPASGNSKP